jgi:hypothetical protein
LLCRIKNNVVCVTLCVRAHNMFVSRLYASIVRIVCEFVCSICVTIVVYLQMSDIEDEVTDEE